ncbi:protein phosphatase 2C domain-containing protein [Frigidibacter sp. MR17.14]|uniref:PP2C family protein-serine/threonine phosphatase n=1 Tax=Frigidibacter sp. MR17.14 TaxID=3126509 RepID=UPI003012DD75
MIRKGYRLEGAGATDIGCQRSRNEDSFLLNPEAGLWLVADGMGGHAAGDVASRTITEAMAGLDPAPTPERQHAAFHARLDAAQDAILQHSRELGGVPVGATMAALLIHGLGFACIWAGDSRVYQLRDGVLRQVTTDHTEAEALVQAGTLSRAEADRWPRRGLVTRAVGIAPDRATEVVAGFLAPGDTFLLCSDGLTEHVTDPEIAQILAALPPESACTMLIEQTLARGALDNVTAVVVRCHLSD